MKLTSTSTILTLMALLMTAKARSSSDDGHPSTHPLQTRADEILDRHYARDDYISQLSTRDIVAELEARLEGRGAIFDAVMHETSQTVHGVTNKVQGVWKAITA